MDVKVYGGWSNSLEIREKSSSGGIFSEIAKYVLGLGGTVYGASLTVSNKGVGCQHIECRNVEDLALLCGAKYMISDVGDTYSKIKNRLKNMEWVLFCGTPCQVGALYSFLGKDYPTLYTIDLICHGIPSPRLSEKIFQSIETERKAKIKSVNFRNKTTGWELYSFQVLLENGEVHSEIGMNSNYMKLFFSDMFLRESCYQCKFKGMNHCSDITLGDFWGISKYHSLDPEELEKGVSVILSYTERGNTLLEKIGDSCTLFESTYHVFDTGNRYYKQKADKPFDIKLFRDKMNRYSSEELLQRIEKRKELRKLVIRIRNKLLKTSNVLPKQAKCGLPNHSACYSCSSCKISCPVSAIEMVTDSLGFEYPQIIETKCVHCHICEKVCPSLIDIKKK